MCFQSYLKLFDVLENFFKKKSSLGFSKCIFKVFSKVFEVLQEFSFCPMGPLIQLPDWFLSKLMSNTVHNCTLPKLLKKITPITL